MPFTPHLHILPAAQRRLWDEFTALPGHFVLYGGTALALRTGSRISEDFDFFTNAPVDALRLHQALPFLRGADLVQSEPGTATFVVDRGGPVNVSFFSVPIGRTGHPDRTARPSLLVASLLDLAAQKVRVVQVRAEKKDYLDIATLLGEGVRLAAALGAAKALYPDFAPLVTLKALSYFGDGDLGTLPADTRQTLTTAVADLADIDTVGIVSSSLT